MKGGKNMKKIFNQGLTPACEYCLHGRLSPDESMVLCVKKGFMLPSSSCRSFKYDALKRLPKKGERIATNFTPEDFSL